MPNGDIQSTNSTGLFTDLMHSFNCMKAKIYNILYIQYIVFACSGSFTWTCEDQRKDTKHAQHAKLNPCQFNEKPILLSLLSYYSQSQWDLRIFWLKMETVQSVDYKGNDWTFPH